MYTNRCQTPEQDLPLYVRRLDTLDIIYESVTKSLDTTNFSMLLFRWLINRERYYETGRGLYRISDCPYLSSAPPDRGRSVRQTGHLSRPGDDLAPALA